MAGSTGKHSRRSHGRLLALFDWFSALPPDEAALYRREIIATVMLRPVALLLSSAGILLMSGTAALLLPRIWTRAWFAFDIALLALRMAVEIRYRRHGRRMPENVARWTVCVTGIVLLVLALGCAASFYTAVRPMPMIATTAMMALIAGLATRWAALPRLAIPAIATLSAPFAVAIATTAGGNFRVGLLQFVVVVAGTAALTLQNHRVIVAMFRAERRAHGMAMTDILTGLPNRGGLLARLDGMERESGETVMALLFVDMDGFKAVNDRFGHAAGDRVLIETAARLSAVVAPHFTCRLGGDEFVVVIEGRDTTMADVTARRIADALAEPFEGIAAEAIMTGASVGIAFGSTASGNAAEVLVDADRALYLAKRAGGGREAVIRASSVPAAA